MPWFDLRARVRGAKNSATHVAYLKESIVNDPTGSINDLIVKYIKEQDTEQSLGIGSGSYNDLIRRFEDA